MENLKDGVMVTKIMLFWTGSVMLYILKTCLGKSIQCGQRILLYPV